MQSCHCNNDARRVSQNALTFDADALLLYAKIVSHLAFAKYRYMGEGRRLTPPRRSRRTPAPSSRRRGGLPPGPVPRRQKRVSFTERPTTPRAPPQPLGPSVPCSVNQHAIPNPFVRPATQPVGIQAQLEQKQAELAALQLLWTGRQRLKGEASGLEDNEMLDADNGQDIYSKVDDGVTTPRVEPAHTLGYDGQPLSREGLRRELANKDLQREFRRHALETPDTVEAEDFMDEEHVDVRVNREFDVEYVVNINVKVWVNKLNVLKDGHGGDFKRSQLADEGLMWVEEMVTEAVGKAAGDEDTFFDKMLVSVKSLNPRGIAVDQNFDDFGATTLSKLLNIADSQYFNYTRHTVRFNFEIRSKCAALTDLGKPCQTRHQAAVSSTESLAPPMPSAVEIPEGGRNDRSATLRRLNAAERRVDSYAMRATVVEELHKLWHCGDRRGPNERNYCYFSTEDPLLHYKLDHPNVESWAYAIERSDPGIDKYTIPLELKTLLCRKGPVQRGSATPNVPTKTQLLKQKQEELEAMELQIQTMAHQEKLTRIQERIEARQERKEALDDERDRREQERFETELLRRRQESGVSSFSFMSPPPTYPQAQGVPVHPPVPHVLPPAPQGYVQLSAAQLLPPQASSPIDPDEDELDLVDEFLTWVINNQKRDNRRAEFQHVKDVASSQYWTLDSLKMMGNPSSHVYKLATSPPHNIPDGITQYLQRLLKTYKGFYRTRKEAATGLIGLGGVEEGGFDRHNPGF
ncbi:hypothetical protein EJ02DRAFT_513907 [Clathrospora elynae]|uniref:Uncharacterized protein n=1 Tax=Clathrospora elynae TaxID=706981 RepID=A0A6A5SGZ9_9PLEO|nr:hypothetical protein EJ02DRAFT_513907 [Clathrospora elynae]